jgi:hypothetical protein
MESHPFARNKPPRLVVVAARLQSLFCKLLACWPDPDLTFLTRLLEAGPDAKKRWTEGQGKIFRPRLPEDLP